MRPYQKERAPGGGHPTPNYPNVGVPVAGSAAGPNMPAPHPKTLPGGGPVNIRSHGQGIPRPHMGPQPGHMQQQQHSLQNNSPAHLIGNSGSASNNRAQSGPPGSRPKPLPGISGSKMAAGRIAQGRNAGMPAFQGQLPGTALSGSETDVSTSTENLTQVIDTHFLINSNICYYTPNIA